MQDLLPPRLQLESRQRMHSMKLTCAISLALALTACGGGGSSSPSTPVTYNVFGNVNGSPGPGLVLQLNGGSSMSITAQGFAWSNALTNGQAYNVTILSQPTGSTCTVSNGSGTISGAGVSNVAVNCVPALSLLAGNMGDAGNLDGPAASARFNHPAGIGLDSAGNIYVDDFGNGAIRKITPSGVVSTISGASDNSAISASSSAAADGSGNFFFSTEFSCSTTTNDGNVYEINSSGVLTTIGNGRCLYGPIAVDSAHNIYMVYLNSVQKIPVTGAWPPIPVLDGPATNNMTNLAVDSAGNVYGAGGGIIQKVTPSGTLTTLAGVTSTTFSNLGAITVGNDGTVYAIDGPTIRKITTAGVVATLAGTAGVTGNVNGIGGAASFGNPSSIAVDNQGNVYITDALNNNVRKITATGVVTTVAGGSGPTAVGSSDGTGAAASFNNPQGITADSAGNAYVADSGNFTIRKITPSGVTTTFAGSPGLAGNVNGTGTTARFGETNFQPYSKLPLGPQGLAVDSTGNVYVGDPANTNIRMISPAGVVTTYAGQGASGSLGSTIFYGYPYPCQGSDCGPVFGFGPEVGPYAVAINSAGNFYLADTAANTMSTITSAGVVTTLGGPINPHVPSVAILPQPQTIVADSLGNAYVPSNNGLGILKITPAGVVSTFAGVNAVVGVAGGSADGVGTAASFNGISGLAIDANDNLYVADSMNCTIRKVTPAAVVSTVVGVAGQCGFAPGALPAHLSTPTNLALSGRTLYITTVNGVAVVANVQ
jgi:sugar lactone lactonase YvrE